MSYKEISLFHFVWFLDDFIIINFISAAAAKSLQSCPTLCDPIDGSPPGFPVPGILQARTLGWVIISFSNAWSEKWKWSCSVHPWDFPGKSTGVGLHCLLQFYLYILYNTESILWKKVLCILSINVLESPRLFLLSRKCT